MRSRRTSARRSRSGTSRATTESQPVPAEVEGRFRSAWSEVRDFWDRLQRGEATREQDPQPLLAAEFFQLFLTNRDNELGRKALSTAFLMWGNTASADAVNHAVADLAVDADYWEPVLHTIINVYHRSRRSAEVVALLHRYKSLLTDPQSQSALFLLLGRHYLHTGDARRAADYYDRTRSLAARARDVQEAHGALYEIGSLGVGQPAPAFEARTIAGDIVRLADFSGRVVCLVFWDTACGPCWGEFPTLRALHAEVAGQAFQLIGISADRDEHARATA